MGLDRFLYFCELTHTLFLQCLIEIHSINQFICLVSNIRYQLILSWVDRLLRLEMTIWINRTCSNFGLIEFALFHFFLLITEEKFWFLYKLFMFLLLPGQFRLNFRLFLRLLCTWVHWSSWQAGPSRGDLSWSNLLPTFITSSRSHTTSRRCYWSLCLCPSRMRTYLRTLCKMFFFLKLDLARLFITNFVIETVYEVNLILLLFRQIFFCFLSLYSRSRVCLRQFLLRWRIRCSYV